MVTGLKPYSHRGLCLWLCLVKDRDFWFGPINSIKLCAEHCTTLGVIKCVSGHVTIFLIEKCQYL